MPAEKTVPIVKQYDRPEFRTKPTRVDLERSDRVELAYLRGQIAALKDKVRRLKEEIEDEVKMLNAALYDDKQETIGQVQRRISRLKGALEYRGSSDYVER